MKDIMDFIRSTGQYAYACARARSISTRLKTIPRETPEALESSVEKELIDLEHKLIAMSPDEIKEALKTFFEGRREVENLKVQFRKYYATKRRAEGVQLLRGSNWGRFVKEGMRNRAIELALDRAWFSALKKTKLQNFAIMLEHQYTRWYEARLQGKHPKFNPRALVKKFALEEPLGWPPLLAAWYDKLEQIRLRRHSAWESY